MLILVLNFSFFRASAAGFSVPTAFYSNYLLSPPVITISFPFVM